MTMSDITPLSATDEQVTISREDYNKLIQQYQTIDPEDAPHWAHSDEAAYRLIDGEVYEVQFDSSSNPKLKRVGVLVEHESVCE